MGNGDVPLFNGNAMDPSATGAAGGASSPPASGAANNEAPPGSIQGAPLVGVGSGGTSSAAGGNTGSDPASAGGTAPAAGAAPEATGGSGSGIGRASAFPEGVTRPRIMIVGDSISAGPGCYKKYLLANLNQNGFTRFDFVGEYTDDCGGGVRHSAVSCSTAEQYTEPTFTMPNCAVGMSFPGMSSLAAEHRPDLVMLQLGVNDVWGGRSIEAILASYAELVAQARAQNPDVVIAVAQIAKMRPDCSADDSIQRRAEMLVNAVPAWAEEQSQPSSPVFIADLWTNSDYSQAETLDCVHPNDVGAQRMGLNWFNALKQILTPD